MVGATYFDGRSSRRQEVRLSVEDGQLCVEGAFGRRCESIGAVDISERLSRMPRTLRFADGAYCEVADHVALAALLASAGHRDTTVANIQRRWRWAFPSMVGVIAVAVATYLWVLPWVADILAPRLPDAMTRTISEQALSSLDAHLLAPSKLPPERQRQIEERLAEFNTKLAAQHLSLPAYRLNFRSAPSLGPNAFALPNGDVVVFDELVTMVKDDDELIAVLAHELGHVKYHHGLRQLIQSTVVSSVVGIWLGDISSVAAGLSALVLDSHYSRDFEREADAYAAHLLIASGGSVTPLIQALQQLEEKHEALSKKSGNGNESLFSSHPETAERISKLRSFAGGDAR
ncbi:MAG TPA: M48 family metallopeptidase [Rhodocyclaceae bacterium]|nr:M48 family metallopeptidase [Rhodocyclaceae bacterium]